MHWRAHFLLIHFHIQTQVAYESAALLHLRLAVRLVLERLCAVLLLFALLDDHLLCAVLRLFLWLLALFAVALVGLEQLGVFLASPEL